MKKPYYLFVPMIWLAGIIHADAQKISYFLPKKVFEVTVPYSIISTKEPGKPETRQVVIKDAITVESKLLPYQEHSINTGVLGKGGRSFNFDIGFDTDGGGFISTINADQTPVTSDIIKGVVGVVGVAARTIAGISGGGSVDGTATVITEQKIVHKELIILKDSSNTEIKIAPAFKEVEGKKVASPTVTVKLSNQHKMQFYTKGSSNDKSGVQNSLPDNKYFSIPYQIPQEYRLIVEVTNNQFIDSFVVIDEHVFVPQFGKIDSLPIPILKGKKKVEIAFNPVTGRLTKYSLSKTSQSKDNLEASKALADDLKKFIEEIKAKSEEEEASADTQQQANLLESQNAKIDLLSSKIDIIMQAAELSYQSTGSYGFSGNQGEGKKTFKLNNQGKQLVKRKK